VTEAVEAQHDHGDTHKGRQTVAPVWLLNLSMASVAVLLLLPHIEVPSGPPGLTWWLLVPLFGVAETFVIHLPTLRNAHSKSFREVPAVAGLAFLAPIEYVTAYVLGSGIALLLIRGQRGSKLAFNASMFALEAVLGSVTYHLVLGSANPAEPRGWVAALAAILVTDIISVVAVTTAISLTENRFDGAILREALRSGLLAAVVNTCTALLVVVLAVNKPAALPLLGVVLAMLLLAYRSHVDLWSGYSRLELLYRFVRSAEAPVDLHHTSNAVLADARDLLRAEEAELVLMPTGEVTGARISVARDGPPRNAPFTAPGASDAWWAPAALGEPVLHARHTASELIPLGISRGGGALQGAPSGIRDGIAVPLGTAGQVSGVLLVTNRTFEEQTFTSEDLRLFETLAGHATMALERAKLVDHLRGLAARREHEARHDALTGLLNRTGLHEAIAELVRGGERAALVLIDLDQFKDINDTLGHPAGDALLVEMGQRLRSRADVVARLGGDEFAVLLTGATVEETFEEGQALLKAIAKPARLYEANVHVTGSIGIALLPEHATTADDLLRHADVAMYAAKASDSGAELYRPEDGRATHRRLQLAGDLHAAIEEHHFQVFYQPQVDASTGRLAGAEALLRWQHPEYGDVPPPEMIALAERTGLLRRLTDAILEDALHQRAVWAALGYTMSVSANITPRDLFDDDLPGVVQHLLATTETAPSDLTLEITESGVMSDPERCLAVLQSLAGLGVRIAVDDFGTGHSSLAYLERLPVHEVKIDKSFVQRMDADASDSTVVRSTIMLAHDLGLSVVAEGVESREAQARMAALGCEYVQGYVISRPLPAHETIPWIRNRVSTAGLHRARG